MLPRPEHDGARGSHSKKNKPPPGAPASRASHTGSVSTEEEPKKPHHIGWIVTQGDRPALDGQGRFQAFGSQIQARQGAQYQGRETRCCTITVQPGEQPRRGTPVENMTRSVLEKNAARQKSKSATAPRVTKPADPDRERKEPLKRPRASMEIPGVLSGPHDGPGSAAKFTPRPLAAVVPDLRPVPLPCPSE